VTLDASAAAIAASLVHHDWAPDTLALSEQLRCSFRALPDLPADWTRLLDTTIFSPAAQSDTHHGVRWSLIRV
jgi:hypothetical protein